MLGIFAIAWLIALSYTVYRRTLEIKRYRSEITRTKQFLYEQENKKAKGQKGTAKKGSN
jgi:hypothetical protein